MKVMGNNVMNTVCVVVDGKVLGAGDRQAVWQRRLPNWHGMIARCLQALKEYEKLISDADIKAMRFIADVANETSLTKAFSQIHQILGNIPVLVYKAAVMRKYGPLTLSAKNLLEEFEVNVVGALTSVHQVVASVKFNGSGTILLTRGIL